LLEPMKVSKVSKISESLGKHYSELFSDFGASSKGVDWGADEEKMHLRYDKMLELVDSNLSKIPSLLDVGCGFGGLYSYAESKGVQVDYTGIDVAENMVDWARQNVPDGQFIQGDFLEEKFNSKYDYIICNGILTQKLDTPGLEMDRFAADLIRKLYSLADIGVAFNVMTTKVNFYSNNLYYRNPAELLSWCLSEISTKIKINHAYPLFEYTVYLYRDDQTEIGS